MTTRWQGAAGDENTWRELMRRHQNLVLAVCCRVPWNAAIRKAAMKSAPPAVREAPVEGELESRPPDLRQVTERRAGEDRGFR